MRMRSLMRASASRSFSRSASWYPFSGSKGMKIFARCERGMRGRGKRGASASRIAFASVGLFATFVSSQLTIAVLLCCFRHQIYAFQQRIFAEFTFHVEDCLLAQPFFGFLFRFGKQR